MIVNVASHEWHKLHRDEQGRIAGDPRARSRLISLGRLSVLWYSVASVLFVVGIGAGGLIFFSLSREPVPGWQGPVAGLGGDVGTGVRADATAGHPGRL